MTLRADRSALEDGRIAHFADSHPRGCDVAWRTDRPDVRFTPALITSGATKGNGVLNRAIVGATVQTFAPRDATTRDGAACWTDVAKASRPRARTFRPDRASGRSHAAVAAATA